MKSLFTTCLILCVFMTQAQNVGTNTEDSMRIAWQYLNASGKPYSPERAFDIYLRNALQGNSVAMNTVGSLYAQGKGTEVNMLESIKWYEKAGAAGDAKGWYNLAKMYHKGYGVTQDFTTAYSLYSKGAAMNNLSCRFQLAYLICKGIGCNQDYKASFKLFQECAQQGHAVAMYYLGMYFRNGYGVAMNADSAKYWFAKAAQLGEEQSMKEIRFDEPEVLSGKAIRDKRKQWIEGFDISYREVGNTSVKAQSNISGEYEGYVMRYDWSGSHVLERSKLKLELTQTNNAITGQWIEDDSLQLSISATLTDSGLIFDDRTVYQRNDRYNEKNALWEFRDMKLKTIADKAGAVYLEGNTRLYSIARKEPWRPIYITLKSKDSALLSKDTAFLLNNKLVTKVDSVHLVTFPNPFDRTINISFELPQSSDVSISVVSMTGNQIAYKRCGLLNKGRHKQIINLPVVSSGAYKLVLHYGKETVSATIIRQN